MPPRNRNDPPSFRQFAWAIAFLGTLFATGMGYIGVCALPALDDRTAVKRAEDIRKALQTHAERSHPATESDIRKILQDVSAIKAILEKRSGGGG